MNKLPILLIGNAIVDDVLTIESYPAEDSEQRALAQRRTPGGNACNSARLLARLGHSVSLASALAADDLADWLLAELQREHIDCRYCVRHSGYATPRSSIWLNRANGSRTIVHHRNLPELSLAELQRIDVSEIGWLHLEGRNVDTLRQYLPNLAAIACPISLEIEKPRPGIEQLCEHAELVVTSSHYLTARNIDAEACLRELHDINPSARLVCTLGAHGLAGMDAAGRIIKLGPERVDRAVDTIGAGDSFVAGLIDARLRRLEFAESLAAANRLAARAIQQSGIKL